MSGAVGPLVSMRLVTQDAARLAAFYRDAFGFTSGPEQADRFGQGIVTPLTLGSQTIELVNWTAPGRPYPHASSSADTIFQHLALVVPDMTAAVARLATQPNWTTISTHGPERLPQASGGVVAFKFRDPEGHPLELLQFPTNAVPVAWQHRHADGPCLGYDHSAVTVADAAASLAFYARLDLAPNTRSINRGVEQARMDDVPGAVVDVIGLCVADAPPHLELLCYRDAPAATPTLDSDVAATQLVFEMPNAAALDAACREMAGCHSLRRIITRDGSGAAMLRDPDGHRLWLVGRDR